MHLSLAFIGTCPEFGTPTFTDGYLSDLYVVDGQALEPTAFGKFFDGKWGPLDSSDVLVNIGYKESPLTLPRTWQKWSGNYRCSK